MLQCFIYPEKFLKATQYLFSYQRGEKFVLFNFQRIFLQNFDLQVTVAKITNDEKSKSVEVIKNLLGGQPALQNNVILM